MTETSSAPGNPGATISLQNEGPKFELPAELREAAPEAAKPPEMVEAQQAQDPAKDPAENPEAAKDEKTDKPRSKIQERIDELTRGKREAEREAARAKADLQKLSARLNERASKVDQNDFNQVEEFRVEKAVKVGQIEATADEVERRQYEVVARRAETFMAKVEAAAETDPSINEKLSAFRDVSLSDFQQSFIAESTAAVELAVHFAKFPNDAARIAKMSPGEQGVELARLEAKLSAPPVRRISQAPTPVPTLGGSRSPAVKDTADMSVSELSAMLYGKKSA